MTAGGGLDIGLTEHIMLRAIQADYYLTHFDNGVNTRQNNFRIGARPGDPLRTLIRPRAALRAHQQYRTCPEVTPWPVQGGGVASILK